MKDLIIALVLNNAMWAFIQFLINRHDKKTDDKDGFKKALEDLKKEFENFCVEIKGKLKRQEKDGIRTQLLLLILMKPEEETEILRIAEHYFKVLKGNWYMTTIFNNWLTDNGIGKPDWFKGE